MVENIYNDDGRRYTLAEYFRDVNNEGLFQIQSESFGHLITGTYKQIVGDLRKVYFGSPIKKIEITEYGTILYTA